MSRQLTLDGDERRELLERGEQHAKKFWQGFLDFAFSGNVLEVAFGLILASAFTSLTNSLVSDILLPPLSVILPLNRNLDEKFAVLQAGPNYDDLNGYTTLDQAVTDGAVVLAYGVFLNKCVNFLGLGIALYIMALMYQRYSHEPIIKHQVKCRYCRKKINEKSQRCIFCTSWQDGREEMIR
ncbi:large-conductance mechanosensitive channel [Pseudomassariella vexata]|uniref:Large-conductance mechanosensitive channel n=1 Tax=Pseudomassariella vexata TaxID=1141098 RepID=A0A1Y2DUX0_9PEZI|nr:large-conductance mechanosensitive channel [Pseudomassariella vexata]ORY63061.1 large-conductance mechanosensitive channel [Pseudomassariella vexata]